MTTLTALQYITNLNNSRNFKIFTPQSLIPQKADRTHTTPKVFDRPYKRSHTRSPTAIILSTFNSIIRRSLGLKPQRLFNPIEFLDRPGRSGIHKAVESIEVAHVVVSSYL
jgi:hypothetical protein